MRFVQKKKLMEAADTMKDAHEMISELCMRRETEQIYDMLIQLQEMAMKIGEAMECDQDCLQEIVEKLERYCEQIYECSMELENDKLVIDRNRNMMRQLERIENLLVNIKAKIKVAFFPYKYSMWDALESIWTAADNDEMCECQVVPVPYYIKNEEGQLSEMNYEGADFEKVCPILDHREYRLEEERPDIMYIHNPYDQYNRVTMIDERFFSGELKKYGGLLVYVPYYIAGFCGQYENMDIACKGIINSDYIILQSKALKEAYLYWGVPEKKLLVLGSPKIDAVKKSERATVDLDEKWKRAISGKKVVLFNSSIVNFVADHDWLLKMKEHVLSVIQKEDMALIWRPHPLLKETIQTMENDKIEQYAELVKTITEAENAVVDDSSDAYKAIKLSDAMVSDYSSLALQYMFTGKPAFLWNGSSKMHIKYLFCNIYGNYFFQDGISLETFLEMVRKGEDPKREERLQSVPWGIENTDGTCGEKIHAAICQKAGIGTEVEKA